MSSRTAQAQVESPPSTLSSTLYVACSTLLFLVCVAGSVVAGWNVAASSGLAQSMGVDATPPWQVASR